LKSFDQEMLREVVIYFAEPSEQIRAGFRSTMHSYGIRHEHIFAGIVDLSNAIKASPPDLLIVDGELGLAAFDLVRDIRQFKLGRNPFIVISVMVDAKTEGAAQRAILSGADDVLIKPVAPGTLLDRVAYFTMHRLPFIVTSDYLGPERRRAANSRPSKIKHLEVVNTLKAKIDGSRLSVADLDRALKGSIDDMMSARLDSNALRLSSVSADILKSYEEKRVDKKVEGQLRMLVDVLQDAARTARTLDDPDLSQVCVKLASQIHEMGQDYEAPTSIQLSTIQKLASIFDLAKSAKKNIL